MKNRLLNAIVRTPHYLVSISRLVWKRLPYIALYTVAFAGIIGGAQYLYGQYDRQVISRAPATDFINYTSFSVQNAREGEDVIFTLCRTHDQNYRVDGTRIVYIIPEGKTEPDKVAVHQKNFEGIIDSGNCQSYFIRNNEYYFKPGKYLITLNLDFKVKYNIGKTIYVKSEPFTIYPQPQGTGDVQSQLNILRQQIQDQQEIINRLSFQNDQDASSSKPSATIGSNTPPASQAVTPATGNSGHSGNSGNSGNTTTSPPAKTCRVDVLFISLGCQ